MWTYITASTNFTNSSDFTGICIEDPARPGYFLVKTENTTGWGAENGGTYDD